MSLEVVNQCLIYMPVPDTGFISDSVISLVISAVGFVFLCLVIGFILLTLVSYKWPLSLIARISIPFAIGMTIGMHFTVMEVRKEHTELSAALKLAKETMEKVSVYDPGVRALNDSYRRGERLTKSEVSDFARLYNQHSSVIKEFALREGCTESKKLH
ncbi:hypothetical protein R4575_18360 [Acinetobacter baumannii]|nr:hypothetical protein [Acinetobacter baumannii]